MTKDCKARILGLKIMKNFSLENLTSEQKKLRKRILEISHEAHLSHLGSCLSAVDLIDAVYSIKKRNEKFILSNGHAGIAWYAVLEKHGFVTKEAIRQLRIHPDRNPAYDIHVSTGSLGQGLPIALGIALAERSNTVYCMLSDGECAEGSIWEALRVIEEQQVYNLKIIINANGWSAYNRVDLTSLLKKLKAFGFSVYKSNGHNSNNLARALGKTAAQGLSLLFAYTCVEQFPFLQGQDAHYYVMKNEDYNLAMKLL